MLNNELAGGVTPTPPKSPTEVKVIGHLDFPPMASSNETPPNGPSLGVPTSTVVAWLFGGAGNKSRDTPPLPDSWGLSRLRPTEFAAFTSPVPETDTLCEFFPAVPSASTRTWLNVSLKFRTKFAVRAKSIPHANPHFGFNPNGSLKLIGSLPAYP